MSKLYESSSSSDSSNDSGSDSSGSYSAAFSSSSKTSISSCSTIVIAPPVLEQFGCPQYNYFWIENKSKSNPKLSYYYNFKSHSVVWQRPLLRDVPMPVYESTWAPKRVNLSDEDDDILVSEEESKLARKRRLRTEKINKRLLQEEQDDSLQVLSIRKILKGKRMLETLWKLHRFPGETLQELKKRLLESAENTIPIKIEKDCDDAQSVEFNKTQLGSNIIELSIKQEPDFIQNEDQLEVQITDGTNEVIKKLNYDSDSDPDHVSFIIKQEYLMQNGTDNSEVESKSEEDNKLEINIKQEIPEESSMLYEFYETDSRDETSEEEFCNTDDNSSLRNMNLTEDLMELDDYDYNYENPSLLELLEVEIHEDVERTIPLFNLIEKDTLTEDKINWAFEKSIDSGKNSQLTTFVLNPINRLVRKKRFKKRPKRLAKKTSMSKKVRETKEKKNSNSIGDGNKVIICNMYGVQTRNYNIPPTIKDEPREYSNRLSNSSSEESENETRNITLKKGLTNSREFITLNDVETTNKKDASLYLRSWFPMKRRRQTRRSKKDSDTSWCPSNLSDYSDVDDFDKTLFKIKKEKVSSSEDNNDFSFQPNIMDESIDERESQTIPRSVIVKFDNTMSVNLYPVVDLSKVKIEKVSSDLEAQTPAETPKFTLCAEKDDKHSPSSSSSSSSCSRSSCSCSSCSSSTDSEDNADDLVKKEDL